MLRRRIEAAPLLVRHSRGEPAGLPVICFPYAGAGASAFAAWGRISGPAVDVYAVQAPGRENRLREPGPPSIPALAEAVVERAAGALDGPYAMFGYSLGALVAWETARRLTVRGLGPSLFVAASCLPPHAIRSLPPITGLADTTFLQNLSQRYGGLPAEFLANPELREMFLPTLRVDLGLIERYRCDAARALACPVLAVAGVDDASLPQEALVEWDRYTSGSFHARLFPGGHFFVRDFGHWLLAQIAELARPAAR